MRSYFKTNRHERLDRMRRMYKSHEEAQEIIQYAIMSGAHGWARAIIPRRGVRGACRL
nr:MAG TPA: hypothetical protein [Caudoviricetes sp.]